MSISISGRVAKCVASAEATAAQTATEEARRPMIQPPSPIGNLTADNICLDNSACFPWINLFEVIAPSNSSQLWPYKAPSMSMTGIPAGCNLAATAELVLLENATYSTGYFLA